MNTLNQVIEKACNMADVINGIHVKSLQKDLFELGFSLIKETGSYDLYTKWAVRELQIYAKMPFIAQIINKNAKHYVERLGSIQNINPYKGAISGIVDTETLTLIQDWKSKQIRCPVVISACYPNTKIAINKAENIWLHDEITEPACVYGYDFSHYYMSSQEQPSKIDLHPPAILLGKYIKYLTWGGPCSLRQHVWPTAEMMPENLAGADFAAMNNRQQSTYKVIRAVAEIECLGFFDCINAYDNAFISLGPCHWTFGIKPATCNNQVEEGELGAYLAYLQYKDPAAFKKTIGNFGVDVEKKWINKNGIPNGSELFNNDQHKYTNWFLLQTNESTYTGLIKTEVETNYFRTWHWFYRFIMATRTSDGFRKSMWDMTCIRIKDILSTPYPPISNLPFTEKLTIGDIYTSEKAIAILLRWHIRFPADVISHGHASERLINALHSVNNLFKNIPPEHWQDQHEAVLISELNDLISQRNNADLRRTIDQIIRWPHYLDRQARNYLLESKSLYLSEKRHSFQFIE